MDQGKEVRPRRVDHWLATVEEQANSGRSVREFCASRGIALSQSYYWRRRLTATKQLRHGADSEAGTLPVFVEVDWGRSARVQGLPPLEIRLDLGGGCTLTLRRG
ncbi:IS66 family insertion sequence element accessory protein TnpA [Acidithiobacillus caldus]